MRPYDYESSMDMDTSSEEDILVLDQSDEEEGEDSLTHDETGDDTLTEETEESALAMACPGQRSMFQGPDKLPDTVIMMIMRSADFDLNVLRACTELRSIGTGAFADYWLGRIIHAEETTLNDATAPSTSKRSGRWSANDSVKIQTDGRSAASRSVAVTEFTLQKLVSSAAKRLNVHRILEIVAHGEATGHRGEMCKAIMRACDHSGNALHASMLTRFPYILDVAYVRIRRPHIAVDEALMTESTTQRRAARAALSQAEHVECMRQERPFDEDRSWRRYGWSKDTMHAKWKDIINAAKTLAARLRPRVEAAVRAETIGGVPVFTTQAEVDAAVANAGLDVWGYHFRHLEHKRRPSLHDEMRMFLLRYMDPVTRPWVVRSVGPLCFWNTSGLRTAGDFFNTSKYFASGDADVLIRAYFDDVYPCGGMKYFRLAHLAGDPDPNNGALRNLGAFSADLFWDTSLLESLAGTFANSAFCGRVGHWNVSRVTTLYKMLDNNNAFDARSILKWNVQRVRRGDLPDELVAARPAHRAL
jgi:hypothetical protein